MLVCGVNFKENGKIYNFDINQHTLEVGDNVIVQTEKGEQLGKTVFIKDLIEKGTLNIILRKATEEDYNLYLKNSLDAKKSLQYAKQKVKELKLNMQLIDASYTFDRKQLLFNFISDERVDFRELVKLLAYHFKTRIELHQVGVRDKACNVGGIGICGHQLCCNKFLKRMDTISINMAKNQNIALNPTKINGACGRLLCCFSYEDDTYTECRKGLRSVGEKIKVNDREGRIINVDILSRKYKVDFNGVVEVIESE